jgi:uncharacterized protein (DUF1501 family)
MPTTRRDFLRHSAFAALGLGLTGGVARRAPALAPSGVDANVDGPPVVVVVMLDGGNDGLNTIVPLAQYDLYRSLRPTLALAPEQLLPLDGYENDFSLHAAMASLADLFALGQVAVIAGAGPPVDASYLFNHEASRRVFETADVRASSMGWLGRFLDEVQPERVPSGVDFGTTSVVLQGQALVPLVIQSIDTFRVVPSADAAARLAAYARLQGIPFADGGAAEYGRHQRLQLLDLSDLLGGILAAYEVAPGVQYPNTRFALSLRDCAALIASDTSPRALAVRTGGFDTHSGQNDDLAGTEPIGFHGRLLGALSDALAAFHADLAGHGIGRRVVTVVHSEFGRRAPENISLGTDHGLGSVMFVIGEAVRGGVYGGYPRLDRLVLDGNLEVTTDFRSVFATILDRHLDADPQRVLGASFPALGFL